MVGPLRAGRIQEGGPPNKHPPRTMSTTTATATYTKLRDGSWGVRAPGKLTAGQSVTVTKRDGTRKTETVGKVLWTGDGVTLATISGNGGGRMITERQAAAGARGRVRNDCCGYPCPVTGRRCTPNDPCHDCQ